MTCLLLMNNIQVYIRLIYLPSWSHFKEYINLYLKQMQAYSELARFLLAKKSVLMKQCFGLWLFIAFYKFQIKFSLRWLNYFNSCAYRSKLNFIVPLFLFSNTKNDFKATYGNCIPVHIYRIWKSLNGVAIAKAGRLGAAVFIP